MKKGKLKLITCFLSLGTQLIYLQFGNFVFNAQIWLFHSKNWQLFDAVCKLHKTIKVIKISATLCGIDFITLSELPITNN